MLDKITDFVEYLENTGRYVQASELEHALFSYAQNMAPDNADQAMSDSDSADDPAMPMDETADGDDAITRLVQSVLDEKRAEGKDDAYFGTPEGEAEITRRVEEVIQSVASSDPTAENTSFGGPSNGAFNMLPG